MEDRFGFVRLRGELSGVKRAASGHFYCALKDEGAVIDGVMWKGNAARMNFRAEDGLEVIATGKLTTYPGRSKYQIVIDSLELRARARCWRCWRRPVPGWRRRGCSTQVASAACRFCRR